MEFHHVGIAVENIEEALLRAKEQYPIAEVTEIIQDEKQGVYACLVTLKDGFRMELISGENVKSLLKRGQNLYHVCYKVDDLDQELEKRCQCVGNMLVSPPKEAVLFDWKRIAFIKTDFGLIELLER